MQGLPSSSSLPNPQRHSLPKHVCNYHLALSQPVRFSSLLSTVGASPWHTGHKPCPNQPLPLPVPLRPDLCPDGEFIPLGALTALPQN